MNFYVQDTWKVTSHFTVNYRLALGTVLPAVGNQWLGVQLQPGESDRGSEEHAIRERASRTHLPGRPRLHRQDAANKDSGICLHPAWRWLGIPRATVKW